jgi:DnaJ-class molecular chaperone
VICNRCGGSGWIGKDDAVKCLNCCGDGEVFVDVITPGTVFEYTAQGLVYSNGTSLFEAMFQPFNETRGDMTPTEILHCVTALRKNLEDIERKLQPQSD